MGLLFLHISVCCSTDVARRLARVSENRNRIPQIRKMWQVRHSDCHSTRSADLGIAAEQLWLRFPRFCLPFSRFCHRSPYLYNSSGENNLRKSLAREVRKKTASEAETLSNWKLRICNIKKIYISWLKIKYMLNSKLFDHTFLIKVIKNIFGTKILSIKDYPVESTSIIFL